VCMCIIHNIRAMRNVSLFFFAWRLLLDFHVRLINLGDYYLASGLVVISSVFAWLTVAVPSLAHAHVVLDDGFVSACNVLLVAILVAKATVLGALGPLAEHFVLFADEALVVFVFNQRWAVNATVRLRDKDGPPSDHTTLVFLLESPSTPAALLAVLWAFPVVARTGINQRRAYIPLVSAALDNVTSTRLLATTTGLVAWGEGAVRANHAVDGAWAKSARDLLMKLRAHHATETCNIDNDAVSVHVATFCVPGAAALAALTPRFEVGDLAILRAGLAVAEVLVFGDRAGHTSECGLSDDLAGTSLGTLATRLGALGPLSPLGDTAIDGAFLGLARNSLTEGRAYVSVVFRVPEDGSGASSGAITASLGAGSVDAPCGNVAVHRAGATLAWNAFHKDGARTAIVLRSGDDGTSAGLLANVAGHRALTINGPVADLAGNSALLVNALGFFLEGRAYGAVSGGLAQNLTFTLLGANATLLAASMPN